MISFIQKTKDNGKHGGIIRLELCPVEHTVSRSYCPFAADLKEVNAKMQTSGVWCVCAFAFA